MKSSIGKLLAVLLAVIMALSMVACGGNNADENDGQDVQNDAGTSTDTNEDAADADTDVGTSGVGSEVEGEIDNAATGEIGMYDPNRDYSANPTYKICYYVLNNGVLYEGFDKAFGHWSELINVHYDGMRVAGGDKDAFLSNLQTLAEEYDGILIDPDAEQYARCAEILNEAGCAWMGCMAEARDYSKEGSPLLHPYCGFNNYEVGVIMANYLIGYAEKNWPDVDPSEIAWATVDHTTSPVLHTRAVAYYDTLVAYDPTIADRFFTADTSIAMFDMDTSNTVMSAVLAANTDYEYWCVFAEVDDMAMGAAAALDTAGLTDTGAVVTFGGEGLRLQWDAGMQDAWVAACYAPYPVYSEPLICGLYAFMCGDATPETIWPEWVPKSEVAPYAMRMLPAYWLENDSYQHVIKWGDVYGGADMFPDYPTVVNGVEITRDDFSTKVAIPEDRVGYEG